MKVSIGRFMARHGRVVLVSAFVLGLIVFAGVRTGAIAQLSEQAKKKLTELANNEVQAFSRLADEMIMKLDKVADSSAGNSTDKRLEEAADKIIEKVQQANDEIAKKEDEILKQEQKKNSGATMNDVQTFFSSKMNGGGQLEQSLVALIQKLIASLSLTSNENVKAKIKLAILALRSIGKYFDTTAPVATIMAPANDSKWVVLPEFQVKVTDSLSGVDAQSLKVIIDALVPVGVDSNCNVQTTTSSSDTTSAFQIVSSDSVTSEYIWKAASYIVPDGTLTINASAADAAGNTGYGSSSFTLDRTAPAITISSPVNGSTVDNPNVALSADVVDLVLGVGANTVVITFNGQVVNAAIPSGNCVHISTGLVAKEGMNTVTISASDFGGNFAEKSATFEYSPSGLPKLHILKVDGDNQKGLAITAAPIELRVRVVDDDGKGVEGIYGLYEVIENDGLMLRSPTYDFITDSDGIASVRFTCGSQEGANRVRVSVLQREDVESIEFTETSVTPSIEAIVTDLEAQTMPEEMWGLGNDGIHYGEYAGNAVGPFRMRVTYIDPATNQKVALTGARVIPTITKKSDDLVPDDLEKIGEMWPEMGITDGNGIVSFGYLLKSDMPFDTADTETFPCGDKTYLRRIFNFRFYLVDYEPYKRDMNGNIIFDNDNKPLYETANVRYCVVGANNGPAPVGGQGQVIGSGGTTVYELKSKVAVSKGSWTLGFAIVNGDGELIGGELSEDKRTSWVTSVNVGGT